MKRIEVEPRKNWKAIIENQGLPEPDVLANNTRGVYWVEDACYALTSSELNEIRHASEELHKMYLAAIEDIVDKGEFSFYGVPSWAVPFICNSWSSREPVLLSRFDFSFHSGQLKLLEYNALPTSLMESTIIQGLWFEQRRRLLPSGSRQANNMKKMLANRWRYIANFHNLEELCIGVLMEYDCDTTTAVIIEQAAKTAGLKVTMSPITQIDYDPKLDRLITPEGRPIHLFYKLYPWEWVINEPGGKLLTPERVSVVEPWWKFFISNKKILLKLWELFPGHRYLLETSLDPIPYRSPGIVKKAIHGREGSNIHIKLDDQEVMTSGEFANSGFIYQRAAPLPCFSGNYALVSAWMVGDQFAGISVREDDTLITALRARFVPHIIVD